MDWWTLGLQTINFLVLVGLLQHFLYRPVLAAIDRRRDELDRMTTAAQDAKTKARQAEAEWRARQKRDEGERQELRRQALAEAKRVGEEILRQARQDAAHLREQHRAAMAEERGAAAAQLRQEAATVAVELAGRLLARVAPGVGAEPFLEMAEHHLLSLSPAERDGLFPGAGDRRLDVEVFPPLSAQAEAEWGRRLAESLRDPSLTIIVQPDLVAGVRLTFPTATIELSWAETLSAAQREMGADAKPA